MQIAKKDQPLFNLTVGEFFELQNKILQIQTQKNDAVESVEILTIEEASEFLHLSVATLYTLNCKRRIPFTKVSGKVYYKRSSLLEWLNSGERKTKAQLNSEIQGSL